jgi:hypothetical protein
MYGVTTNYHHKSTDMFIGQSDPHSLPNGFREIVRGPEKLVGACLTQSADWLCYTAR